MSVVFPVHRLSAQVVTCKELVRSQFLQDQLCRKAVSLSKMILSYAQIVLTFEKKRICYLLKKPVQLIWLVLYFLGVSYLEMCILKSFSFVNSCWIYCFKKLNNLIPQKWKLREIRVSQEYTPMTLKETVVEEYRRICFHFLSVYLSVFTHCGCRVGVQFWKFIQRH